MLINPETKLVSWHSISTEEAVSRLKSDLTNGLTEMEAKTRLQIYGLNTVTPLKGETFLEEFLDELREPMVLMLLVTGVLYLIWGELADAITIFLIILTLNTIEVINELRSKKAINSIQKLAEPTAAIRREGKYLEIPVDQVVPGDLIYLRAGHRSPADARLIEAIGLSMDESALTGESISVDKSTNPVSNHDTPLAERDNMVYSSSLVTRGKGIGLVISTGMNTEIGRITGMTRQIKEPRTPLQIMMNELSKSLVWFALGFSVFVPLIGIIFAHQPPKQMILTGLSLAFATIPEEMPIIITMVLALGAFRLSKKHAIVKHLSAVETLGSVTVIATDKTGTLTENRMKIASIFPKEHEKELLNAGVLCNDAIQDGKEFSGDPIDTALLREARIKGMNIQTIQKSNPIINEFTFDNENKRMSVIIQEDGHYLVLVKGAPESILSQCIHETQGSVTVELNNSSRQTILDRVEHLAVQGLRIIAFARRNMDQNQLSREEVEKGLTFLGLIGLQDTLRPEATQAIELCKRAGIRTIMITGDHPLTASSIGTQVGLNTDQPITTGSILYKTTDEELIKLVKHTNIYSRTTPEQKLRIVQALQTSGERVAVTGDGVNDAPALSQANIGIAMGQTGTDVAREAADMVLLDDNFSTIVNSVREGRLIYENLKKGVGYYLACKLALVFITLIPTLLLIPVPFAPIQIILMELFMDLMAAAAFVAEKEEFNLLDKKPRNPNERFMDKGMVSNIFTASFGLFAAVTILYLYTWFNSQDLATAQTVAFFSWLIGHLLLAFNMRSKHEPLFRFGLFRNRLMLLWTGLVVAFIILSSTIPGAQQMVKITTLTASQWVMILTAVTIGTFWLEMKKWIYLLKQPYKS